jgi:outer membrane protein assembly factor BamE (lipoprotein component of BamABCDE complex)
MPDWIQGEVGKFMRYIITVVLLAVSLMGCMSASQHRQAVQDDTGDKLTVGTVQKEIRVGMSGAEVAEVLGSPNIVSTDEERREVWIYDKVATDYVKSSSSGGVSALLLGIGGSAAGLGSGSYSSSAGASSRSQRTLTIIIKYDNEGKVRDFAYHTSKF